MSSQQESLRINGWENGIATSPHTGIGLIRNANIEALPGAVKVELKPTQMFFKINTVTFTADAGTDLCTASGSIEANAVSFSGAAVYFTTTGTLPAGLSTGTIYFLYYVSATTFKVCTSYKNSAGSSAGTVINITDAGTGTHTMNAVSIGTINWMISDPRTDRVFFLSSNGRVWTQEGSMAYLLINSAVDTPSSGVANASGNGIAISSFSSTSATYLFVFRNAVIDVINVFGTTNIETPSWSNSWQTLNTASGTSNSHEAINGQDEAIYFCDSRYVGSIIENAGSTFDPATGGTFTYNNQALDLPPYEVAQCLEEQGEKLLIGGNTFNKIYPWDRISDSFDLPIPVAEKSIKRLKNLDGTVYILAGTSGVVYSTQGNYSKFVRKLPINVVNSAYSLPPEQVTWGGISSVNGAIIFGVSATTSGASGVWKLFTDGRLIQTNYPSTGSANVSSLYPQSNGLYYMGYNGGADDFSNSLAQYSNYETVLQSGLLRVGSKTHKAAYSELEVQTATPATSGSIRIKYRTSRTASFSDFTPAINFSADSSSTSFKSNIGLTDLENLQIQVEMHGNIELLDVILYP